MEQNKKNQEQDDDDIFEYYDNDLGPIRGKVTPKANGVMNFIILLSIVVGTAGGLLLYLSDNYETQALEGIGTILLVVAGFGIIFFAPFIASYFND